MTNEAGMIFPPPAHLQTDAHIPTMGVYHAFYRESIRHPERFWTEKARRLHWFRTWDEVLSWDFNTPRIEWFLGGKLNACYNCLDRHVEAGYGQETALIWEGNNPGTERIFTYLELQEEVCRAANAFKTMGIGRGDRVCIYLQMIPELAIAMLACARIGAVHSVVFGAFSDTQLRSRINDAGCRLLITQDTAVRGARTDVPMKASADAALADAPTIERVLVVRRTGAEVAMFPDRDCWWHEAIIHASNVCAPEQMDAEDPLFILYTSGSTGRPKGMVHTTGGYMVYASFTHELVFDYHPGQVYWCTADIGWITGHSYIIYGPLTNRATTVMFEGIPSYPDYGRFWQVVEQHRVNIFYTSPTALRALRKQGDAWPAKYDLSSLRVLGSVGEPIKPPEWLWYHHVIGKERCPIVDTWWQTETGGIMLSPLPAATPTKPGSASLPLFGIQPVLCNEDGGILVGDEVSGHLVIAFPWPGMARTIWGDHQRFRETYFSRYPGYYFTGDGCRRDADGYHWITGRVDDIIIVSGHNLGTAEVEGAIGTHPAVAEAAVVGIPHEVSGQAIYAFVTLKAEHEPSQALADEIVRMVRAAIGPHATPAGIQFTPAMPTTRSGKIMRRLLGKIAVGAVEDLGDTSTLSDPGIVTALIAGRV